MPHPTITELPSHPDALQVKHPIAIQNGRIEVLLYGAFRSKKKPALQTSFRFLDRNNNRSARVDSNLLEKGHCEHNGQKCLPGSVILPALFRLPSKLLQKILHTLHLASPKNGCRSASIIYVQITRVRI